MKKILLTALMFAAVAASAQENAAGLWAFVNIKQKFNKGFALNLRSEYRCKDNFTANDDYVIRVAGDWKPIDYFQMSIGYDYHGTWKDKLRNEHRALLDLKGMYKVDGWDFSLRERYLYNYMPSTGGQGHLLRTMPKVAYKIPNSIFTPYVEVELYNQLNEQFALKKVHLFVGTELKANEYNTFKVFYLMQANNLPDVKFIHTVGLEYDITLPYTGGKKDKK